MGMSADYTIAVELGSTMVRVGTAVFGDRIKNDSSKKLIILEHYWVGFRLPLVHLGHTPSSKYLLRMEELILMNWQ